MRARRGFRFAVASAAVGIAMLGLPAVSAAASPAASTPQTPLGKPWQPPAQSAPNRNLAVLGSGGSDASAQVAAASARARATGQPVTVSGLTTGTTTVTASPNGTETSQTYVLPVRVQQGASWVPVDTTLRRDASGQLEPAAVPGNTVTFSAGGTGPAAVIATAGTQLALTWPGTLPAPVVAGASATYPNVLPGVDLVLTATSAAAGGFTEVLVVHDRAAGQDPQLAQLALGVATRGTGPLQATADGGLVATMTGGRGAYVADQPKMWDSSALSASPSSTSMRTAQAAARAVGATLAAPGSGPAVSSPLAPAGGAQVAPVPVALRGGGRTLSLATDSRMLNSASTKFPVYVDPGFTSTTNTGNKQAYDPVQSDPGTGGCSSTTGVCDNTNCRGSHYNSSSYSFSPVGYDNFQFGPCQFSDTDYALYRVGIPSGMFGSHAVLINASFQTSEVYTSSCSATATVTASWIGAIGSGTGWPGPGPTASNHNATASVGPDSGSCNNTEDTSKRVAAGFNVTANLNAVGGSPSNITFRLWENGNTNDVDHKQFTDNPDLQVTWTETPNNPGNQKQAANSSGAGSLDCSTDKSNPPRIGKTDSVSGLYLGASYSIPDSSTVQGNIRYWSYPPGSSTATATIEKDAAVNNVNSTSTIYYWLLPASYTSGMKNGTIVAWQAQAESGSGTVDSKVWGPYKSSWEPSTACYVAVYPNAPDAPTVASNGFDETVNQPVGSQLKFTITQSSGDTATEFVWGMDTQPPTTGTIPAAQTCTTSAAEAACTQISGGSATLTVTVPSPGPHDVWVYEIDAGGNDSGDTNGAGANQSFTFSGAGDPGCSTDASVCFTAGASLQANFTAALSAGKSFDNRGISTQSGTSGTANFDGGSKSYDEAQLKAAGWNANGDVTVDGATFALPNFGSSTSGPDNLLAANQTIGAGPNGAYGSALVFLAASNNAVTQVGGLATDSPDSGLLYQTDPTVPAVLGGTAVTGNGCTNVLAFNPTTTGTGICVPATGTISYVSGNSCPTQPQQFTLTVPDWISGPSDIAALETPDRDTSSTTQQADSPKIYAFAVPVDSSCAVSSVNLPDVSNSVLPVVSSGGVTEGQPGLHIFGVGLRNTTTATPEVNGTKASTPSQQAWTGAFEAPTEDAFAQTGSHGNQTYRISVSTNVPVPAGAQIRVKLSDPGFTSGDGAAPLQIGAASVSTDFFQAIPGQTPVALTFGGSAFATLPEGGDIYSDPLTLPFAWNPGTSLMISVWLQNAALTYVPGDAWPSGGSEYISAYNTGNQTEDTTGTPFANSWIGSVSVLSAVDVTTPSATIAGEANPGAPTIVVAGDDNLTDAWTSGNHAQTDVLNNPSQRLAGQLASQGLTSGYGVVDAGLVINQALADLPVFGGMSLLSRLDRDVLAEPDVGTVVINVGQEDNLLQAGSQAIQTNLQNAYQVLAAELGAFGINVIIGDLTPCGGYSSSASSCSTAVDTARQTLDSFIDGGSVPPGGSAPPPCPADFDQAVTNGASPEALQTAFDAGDHVNLTLGSAGGYAALAPAVAITGCIAPNITPLPATP